jgi:hypothetical protein
MTAAAKQATCPQCGKRFTPWRAKRFCGERCRKRAENARLGYVRGDEATLVADSQKAEKITKQNHDVTEIDRGDEPPGRGLFWIACNDVTDKLSKGEGSSAVGWTMNVEGKGWFGRCKSDPRGEFSFGPSTRARARAAVEAWLGMSLSSRKGTSGHGAGRATGSSTCGERSIHHSLYLLLIGTSLSGVTIDDHARDFTAAKKGIARPPALAWRAQRGADQIGGDRAPQRGAESQTQSSASALQEAKWRQSRERSANEGRERRKPRGIFRARVPGPEVDEVSAWRAHIAAIEATGAAPLTRRCESLPEFGTVY